MRNKFLLLATHFLFIQLPVFLLSIFWADVPFLVAQQSGERERSVQTDTLETTLLFEIQWLKLEMIWPKLYSLPNYDELIELKLFAQEAYKAGNTDLALIYLNEIFSSVDTEMGGTYQAAETAQSNDGKPTSVRSLFEKSVLWGIDLSQQEYHLTYGAQDSAILESFNNPFLGVKLRWNRYRINKYDLDFDGVFKYSRDYTHWQFNGRAEQSQFWGSRWQVNQQLEGLNYQRFFPVQYWQSITNLQFSRNINRYTDFFFEDEIQYRRYKNESESFPTYFRNAYLLQVQFYNFWNSRITINWQRDTRTHKTFSIYNFDDRRANLQYYFSPSWRSSWSFWYQHRVMRYPRLNADTTYFADFVQDYFSGIFRQNLHEKIALRGSVELIGRDYAADARYTPDYWHLRVQPGILFEFSSRLSVGLDYLLEIKKFDRTSVQASTWIIDENFYSEGIVFSLDFFNYKNLLISLSHTFRLNTYPDALEDPIPGLSLYTDRFENSTMLYVSYQIFKALELSLILQHDLDKDREIENNDSRSSIFSLDLSWKF